VKYVVKLGGATIEDKVLLHACGKAISELVRDGNQVAMVHGGGKQLTATLAQMGKKSEFVSGLRVTDAETRDAALMVLAGRVNKSLVAALRTHGQPWDSRAAMAMYFARARRNLFPTLDLSVR
jgi:acetylglutamate kinase